MNVYQAVSEIQANPPALIKDGRGQYGSYLTLGNLFDAIIPMLAERDVTLVQVVSQVDGAPALTTNLIDSEGTAIGGTMLLMSEALSPQKQGSAITYARRYALCAILGIVPDDDDDGQSATDAVPVRRTVEVPAQTRDAFNASEPTTPF